MIEKLASSIVSLKKEFRRVYQGTSNIQEIIPAEKSETFPVDNGHLRSLHLFAEKNPIYYDLYEEKISDVSCMVYEGDINKYWLSSIQHGTSHAPFSPTWILSAYALSYAASTMGCKQVIDIGSGDGRIAYCAKLFGLDSFSIEIDEMLVALQNTIIDSTGINFNPYCADAVSFDYSSLDLTHPEFFIGGLAQMGGTALASGILDNIASGSLNDKTGLVFAGTLSQKYAPDPLSNAGWGTLIDKYKLKIIKTVSLPTAWTFKEHDETPYLFVNSLGNSNPN